MYQTKLDGKHHELGTSGFLYRSNKVMYDHETKSLWSTLNGEPVVGPLVEKGLKLKRRHVVTTTWGEWKQRHPETTVLSLDTGHDRDYREGMAYHDYFATDDIMFTVPKSDDRLKNKAEVLALRNSKHQLAVSADFLSTRPLYGGALGEQPFVVLTDQSGANRVFETKGRTFVSWDQKQTVTDNKEQEWTMTEKSLTNSEGEQLERMPAHRAFWFGWHAQFPDTQLVK